MWTKLSDAIDASGRSRATISYDSTVPVADIDSFVNKKPASIDTVCKLAKVLHVGAFDLLGMDAFSPDEAEIIDDALAEYERALRAKLIKPGKIDEETVKRINKIVELRKKLK